MFPSVVLVLTKYFNESEIMFKAFNYSLSTVPRLSLSAHIKEWGYIFQIALLDSKCSLGIIYSDCNIFISPATSAETRWSKIGE